MKWKEIWWFVWTKIRHPERLESWIEYVDSGLRIEKAANLVDGKIQWYDLVKDHPYRFATTSVFLDEVFDLCMSKKYDHQKQAMSDIRDEIMKQGSESLESRSIDRTIMKQRGGK